MFNILDEYSTDEEYRDRIVNLFGTDVVDDFREAVEMNWKIYDLVDQIWGKTKNVNGKMINS